MEPKFALAAVITVLIAVALHEVFVRERLVSVCLPSNMRAVAGGFQRLVLAALVLFPTKINQGILVGLILIAPAFAILGAVGGMFAWAVRAQSGGAGT